MHAVRLAAVFVVMFAGGARAAPPIGVVVSGGVGNAKADGYDWHFEHTYQLELGVRTDADGFVGVHLGIGAAVAQNVEAPGSMYDRFTEYGYAPAQLGVTIHRELADSIWFSSWAGVQSGFRRVNCDTLYDKRVSPATTTTTCDIPGTDITAKRFALGGSFGRDFYEDGGHRFGLIATVAYAVGAEDTASEHGDRLASPYMSFVVGLAYRYWPH